MSFYALSAAFLGLLAIPLVIFYFLKLKRPRLDISSLTLWRQVLNDNRVNSPFQKFKRNILLWLQLLLLLLLVLAAMQPYWRGGTSQAHRIPVLLDCSASMAALDKAGGSSRLDAAKKRIGELIDGLLPRDELCLIQFSRTAHKRTSFTNNKKILRDALREIEVEEVPSDIEDALRMTQALARTTPFDEALILSDGNFPRNVNFDLSFKVNYQRVTAAGPNFGITALNARRGTHGQWDIFVQVEGSAEAEGAATLELTQDGKHAGKENLTLSKNGSQRLLFQVSGERATALAVKLTPDGFDSLAADNVAFLNLPATRPLKVFCPESLPAFRHALQVLTDLELYPDGKQEGVEPYDLIVSDRPVDLARAGRTAFFIGLVPSDLQKLVAIEDKPPTAIVDWRRNHPLLQHVELTDMLILDNPKAAGPESDFENLGYEVLAHGARGPLLLEKSEKEKRTFFLLFHTDHSTFPFRVGFPVLVANLAQAALNQAGLAEAASVHTGVLPPLHVAANSACEILGPQSTKREEKGDASGVLSGVPAPRVGYYEILENGAKRARVGASLLSISETKLDSVDELALNEGLKVSAASATLKTDRSLWFYVAFAAFCLALFEWWYFQKRPKGAG